MKIAEKAWDRQEAVDQVFGRILDIERDLIYENIKSQPI